jgi:hypothetical protein
MSHRQIVVPAVLLVLAFAGGLAVAAAPAAPAGGAAPAKGVSPSEQAQFQQKNAEAQMQELQARMFHLAELVRETEPGDASRLLLAVRKAREELIIEQMKEVLERIDRRELAAAAEGQKQIVAKLEELKKLLLAAENDLVLQLERLRKIEAALKKLDAAIAEQQRQEGRSGQLAQLQQQNKPVEAAKFDGAKQEQQKNRQSAESIGQMMKEIGPAGAKAGTCLGAAGGSMSSAESSLSGSKAGDAQKQQADATKKLKDAKDELERERRKLLAEIEKQVRGQVIENLQQMLDRQKLVRESTQKLGERLASADREAAVLARRLATAEQHIISIADQTVDLIEQTQFSVALPPALRSVQRRCVYVTSELSGGRGGAPVVAAEVQIEQDLRDLIDTMKQSAPIGGQPSNCKSCGGSKNKLLAELKVLRLLQLRVNEETRDADGVRAAAVASPDLPEEVRAKIGTVRDNEEQVRAATDQLHKSVCPDCLKEE